MIPMSLECCKLSRFQRNNFLLPKWNKKTILTQKKWFPIFWFFKIIFRLENDIFITDSVSKEKFNEKNHLTIHVKPVDLNAFKIW